jgi:hypothetical protein
MADVSAMCAAVSATLWLQRESLEELLFKLVEEQLVVSTGATRWLHRVDSEVRTSMERVQSGEVMRAVEVQALTASLDLDVDASLAEIADAATEPWSTLLHEHRAALRDLAFEVKGVAAENSRLLDAGAKSVRQTLDTITSTVTTYDRAGGSVRSLRGPILLDEQA